MNQQQTEKDDLEYNDGLGDLLREKDSMQFSWAKTISVIVVLALLVTLGLWAFFKSTGNKDAHETNYANDITETPVEVPPTANVATDGHIENENIKGDAVSQQEVDSTHVDEVIKKLMADQKAAQKGETTPHTQQAAKPAPVASAPAPRATAKVAPIAHTAPAAPVAVEAKKVVVAPRPVTVEKPVAPRVTAPKPKRKPVERRVERVVTPAAPAYYRVVAGTYATRVEADSAVMALGEHNIPGFVRPIGSEFTIQAGAFQSLDKATQHVQLLRSKGYKARVESKK